MPIVLDGTQGITTPMYAGSISSNAVTPVIGFKNKIINGACVIDQRNAGASVNASSTAVFAYTLDRWSYNVSQASKFTVQQNAGSVTPPAGFRNYLGVTSSAATSLGANDYYGLMQFIEGFNCADLDFGTANAKTVTLSFWVRSSLTGTFGGSLQNATQNRNYPFSYTISSANTWEYKTVTITGDTTGTWLTTNGIGLGVYFGLGVGTTYGSGTANAWTSSLLVVPTGSTSVVGTNGATWYITGVQLEVGTQATAFSTAGGSYGAELALCQRYYEKSYNIGTVPATATSAGAHFSTMLRANTVTGEIGSFITFKQSKRASPTMALWDTSGNSGRATRDNFGVSEQTNVTAATQNSGENSTQVYVDSGNAASGLKVHWTASAEL